MKPRQLTLLAAAVVGLVAAQALGLFGGGSPSLLSPVPILLAFPALMGVSPWLVVGVFVALFLVWRPALFKGESRVPVRTLVLLAVVAALSVAVFALGWRFGLKYQGANYIRVCLAISVAMLVGCVVMARIGRRRPSFYRSLALQLLLFAWLGSYALPYLGETP